MGNTYGVEEIVRANSDRKARWRKLKYRRMREDVFAFFRGTDHLFARAWADGLRPADPGPSALICGDLHLENFGAYRSEDGGFFFDINDFDEAIVAPCGFDLTRCVASILLASDVWRLPPVQAERVALAFLGRYRAAVAEMADPGVERDLQFGSSHGPIHQLLGRAAANTQARLLSRQIEGRKRGKPRIRRRGGSHPPVGAGREEDLREAIEQYGDGHERRDAYRVLDVSRRVAGIGSLGVHRFLVLVKGEGPPDGYRLLDLKRAVPSTVLPYLGDSGSAPWPDDVQRVVTAQRVLQARPPAGLDALSIRGKGYRMREMVPAENRSSLDEFRERTTRLGRAVILAGRVTGWSHARGARFVGPERVAELIHWTEGPGLDSILAAAVRQATRARRDFHTFCHAFDRHGPSLLPRSRRKEIDEEAGHPS
jgi:uncharacterized protein (DUF2252 family)